MPLEEAQNGERTVSKQAKPLAVTVEVVRVPPARRIRVERLGNNQYRVVEDIYEAPPTRTVVQRENVPYAVAHSEVKLFWANALGLNGLGDSGLE